MWKIIKTETAKTNHKLGVLSMKINNTMTDNHIMIANTFNKYSYQLQTRSSSVLRVVIMIVKTIVIL